VEGHDCDIQNCRGFCAKERLTGVDVLTGHHVASSDWPEGDVALTRPWTASWTTVHGFTVDQPKG
jgi:hypothetical protein